MDNAAIKADCELIHNIVDQLPKRDGAWQVMEVCGTHTMAIARNGLRSLLPKKVRLISGPGCPVCVTDQSYMDQAVMLARKSSVVIATFGDMIRVPGRDGSLAQARADGAAVEVVYSAQQALDLARRTPDKEVVFLGVGFETTAPCTALAVQEAAAEGLKNFSVLTAHKLIMPAMRALLADPEIQVDAFLCPGHVSVILGYDVYREIAQNHSRPCVVAGFDPGQILRAMAVILEQIRDGRPQSCTVYPAVSAGGNRTAQKLLAEVFVESDVPWRAIGIIPQSGLILRPQYESFDAAKRFELPQLPSYEMPGCRCGDVICGKVSPHQCPLFGRRCTPRDPVGPCMVSSEGACAAAFKYERFERLEK